MDSKTKRDDREEEDDPSSFPLLLFSFLFFFFFSLFILLCFAMCCFQELKVSEFRLPRRGEKMSKICTSKKNVFFDLARVRFG